MADMSTNNRGGDIKRDGKVRFAMLGCGHIFTKHSKAFQEHAARAELVAVCDIDPAALTTAQNVSGAPGFSSLDAMLDAGGFDVLVVATPSGLHAVHGIKAAHAGYHVVIEKPIATRWEDGKQLVKACDNAGVRLFVVKQYRHNVSIQALKKAIELGRFGKIYMVNANVFWSRPQSYYDQAQWRGTWEFDGGALMNQACHHVDLLRWLVGPAQCVHAFSGTLARHIEAEDTIVLNIKWRSGALGSLSVTMLTHDKNYETSITVIGEKGTVKVGGGTLNEIIYWEFVDEDPVDQKIRTGSLNTMGNNGQGHVAYYDNVVKTLRGDAQALTDGREGLHSLEVIIAAYRSARDGESVFLPLD